MFYLKYVYEEKIKIDEEKDEEKGKGKGKGKGTLNYNYELRIAHYICNKYRNYFSLMRKNVRFFYFTISFLVAVASPSFILMI